MGKIDSHKNTEVRGVLAPLGDLAQECNVAIASITHFTKRTGGASTKAIDRIHRVDCIHCGSANRIHCYCGPR
jgi:hypothetical protein